MPNIPVAPRPLSSVRLVSAQVLVLPCLILGTLTAWSATGDPLPPASAPAAVYQLAPGDTLRDLATRLLGGPECLPELMAYNRITNPLLVADGSFIAIPGKERADAIAAIAAATDALQTARDAAAATYALPETEAATASLANANAARWRAAYTEAQHAARLALDKALLAKRLADSRAPIQEGGTLTAVFGDVSLALPGAAAATRALAGDKVPVGAVVRTGTAARAEVVLADGTVVQILPDSELEVTHYLHDRRNDRRESALRVTMGTILGKIKPREKPESTYKLNARDVSIGIRGTDVRLNSGNDEVVRLAVLTGEAQYQTGRKRVTVPMNFGTYAKEGGRPAAPIGLLPPPATISPDNAAVTTAQQRYAFTWTAIPSTRFATFHFELAHDAAFNHPIEDVLTTEPRHRSIALDDGDYYWQIASVDTDGLEGQVRQGKLVVRRQLSLLFQAEPPPVVRGDVWTVGPRTRIEAVPTTADSSVIRMVVDVGGETSWTFWEPKARFGFPHEGTFTLHAHGIDALGRTSPVVEQKVIVDLQPPAVSVSTRQASQSPEGEARIEVTIEARDPADIARIEYRLQGVVCPYTGAFQIAPALASQLTYRAIDAVGNATEWLHLPAAR